jgi:alkylated DNA repair dioxygenase AlkB
VQLSLLEGPSSSFDLTRLSRSDLGRGAWIELAPRCVTGQQWLFDELVRGASWRAQRRFMYEREVDVPRLLAELPERLESTGLVRALGRALSRRYARELSSVALAYYRDGQDSVAMHGDKMGPLIPDTVIAILSLGEPRRFLLAPAGGGPSRQFRLGWGDLLVMGGSCQQHFVHGVPKAKRAGQRISIQFREHLPASTRPPAWTRAQSFTPARPQVTEHRRPGR